ncbi:ABC transporter ATP-binding protein [Thermaerobacter composti]|uniref:ABC transporter ATP-binding protein n=1 Tax=Thermaerobacter composti TaxID=554949 RepID=A0ABZ0QM06_9FIRM|nr:ABC transporter ATP-binding protein [Thermaerobacter composti]WPD18522.1 ABC transporter ATP-binding protein [Thermaerobacter composti]
MSSIEIKDLRHTYYNPHTRQQVLALDGVNLTVGDGEFVTVVGPSGCGKSTLLYLIAGLVRPSSGEIRVDGRVVSGPGSDRGMVFQEIAILPWRTVRQNIAHGLEIQGVAREVRETIVKRYVDLCGLNGFEDKYPYELSGGMRQRVAVARTLASNPKVVLMDEPFAALDAQTRITLAQELHRISLATSPTIIFVTHNVEEALYLGDKVVIMSRRPGRVKSIVSVPVPRAKRTYEDVMGNPELEEIRQFIFNAIREEVMGSVSDDGEVRSFDEVQGDSSKGRRRWWQILLHRTILSALGVAIVAGGYAVKGALDAPKKLDPDVLAAVRRGEPVRVVVHFQFPVEDFHIRYLQSYGTVGAVTSHEIQLQRVMPQQLLKLAGHYWVERVESDRGG